MAEPPQLADGLVAPAQRPEAVQRRLGFGERGHRRGALAQGRERPALGQPRAGAQERCGACGLARGGGGRQRLTGAVAGQQDRGTREPGDGRTALAGPFEDGLGRGDVPRGEVRLDQVGRRRWAVGGRDRREPCAAEPTQECRDRLAGVARRGERGAQAPPRLAGGIDVGARIEARGLAGEGQRGRDVARGEAGGGEGAQGPQQHPRVLTEPRELEALLGGS